MKKVVALRWSTSDGRVEFQPVHEDGSVGLVERTSIESKDSERFLREKKRIEEEWIGKEVSDS